MTQRRAEHQLWFTRRRGAVSGPYPSGLISRYLILGRLDLTDELSVDRQNWQPVLAHPALIPPVLLLPDDAEGREARLQARLREDERRNIDHAGEQAAGHPAVERRAPEPVEFVHHRAQRHRLVQAERRETVPGSVPWMLAGVAVMLVLGLLLLQGDGSQALSQPDCMAPAAPGVNWSYCRKSGLDLQGVDLSGSVLTSADLMAARLAGARLSGADLDYADLRRADLRDCNLVEASLVGAILQDTLLDGARLSGANLNYADLRGTSLEGVNLEGVRLGRTVWTDGRVCAEGSVGQCL